MNQATTREIAKSTFSGYPMFALALLLALAGSALLILSPTGPLAFGIGVVGLLLAAFTVAGLYVLQPNTGALLTLFGSYRGTDRGDGLRWANPFFRKTRISLRAHNFTSDKIKVNDQSGNPIEIAAAIVWRVRDSAQAAFDVEDYEVYVRIQSEAAIRHLASSYPYDEGEGGALHAPGAVIKTLRSSTDQVTQSLVQELSERLARAGIQIEDAKLTHLAYAPEIAGVMLRRQQAEAIISARMKIVTGAVSMVEMALKALSERKIIELDDERKAAMVSNLLVVLCAESEVQPVVNAGTLYN
jgi:regulator of protease activity HflC (stomatin/prohibitin superfamily)